MIDFKIKGTELPVIPEGTIYKCSQWGDLDGESFMSRSKRNLYSYGSFHDGLTMWILSERFGYDNGNFFMFKESDIIRLAKEQGIIIEDESKEEEFVLPEKWFVEVPNELDTEKVRDYFGVTDSYSSSGSWFYTNDKKVKIEEIRLPAGYTKITIEQFKKYVLKKEDMEQEQELIGYRLVKTGLKDAVKAITKMAWPVDDILTIDYWCLSVDAIKQAGVLDLWFEPVYSNAPDVSFGYHKIAFNNDTIDVGHQKGISSDSVIKLVSAINDINSHLDDECKITGIKMSNYSMELSKLAEISNYYQKTK